LRILFVDTKERFPLIFDYFAGAMIVRGFKVEKIEWNKRWDSSKIDEEDINRVIETAKQFDVIILHLGDKPRGKGADIISQIKRTSAKVIVDSVSPLLFEEADAVLSLKSLDELYQIVNDFNRKKDID